MRQVMLLPGLIFALVLGCGGARAAEVATAGEAGGDALRVAEGGRTQAVVLVAADAGGDGRKAERQAADDLAKYIGMMVGGEPPRVLADPGEIDAAMGAQTPVFVVGQLALQQKPALAQRLDEIKKKDPVIRADAIVVQRDGDRVYLAGTNDESHYHAVAWLLHQWGCRWYLPSDIGECIPEHGVLEIGSLDHAYAPPFEMRNFWISWNGSRLGHEEFKLRNFMNNQSFAGMGHALATYTAELAPEGKTPYNVPFADPKTAEHVVEKMAPQMEQRPDYGISLAIEDGSYQNDSPEDARLQAGLIDKYFLKPMMTDPMMAFYSNVGRLLRQRFPDNPTRFGGMAYVNVTIPPQSEHEVPDNLVMWIAPIDIDPNHHMDHPDSPPRQEYREMMYRWADIMDGRVCIYDYDQGMLVWRDIPNPSHMAFREDVKHYAKAGIIGINTESRNAIATVWTNLFIRGQLMWDPEADVDALLQEFYPNFYGPAAEPMGRFWDAIFDAWVETIVTEHEYPTAPAIYTPELMEELAGYIAQAESAAPVNAGGRRGEQYRERIELAKLQWAILDNYMGMVRAAATDADYATAAQHGRAGLDAVLAITTFNPVMTTGVNADQERLEPGGDAAWWPGEVQQYIDLAALTDGSKGTLIQKLPLEWAFHRDPHDTGLPRGWAYKPADLSYWETHKDEYDLRSLKDYPTTEWEMVRTDVYPQAQGIRHPDAQSFTGFLWYKTQVELQPQEAQGNVHVMFPGLFNEAWLYVNGNLVAHREQNPMWWYNDYKFQWDVDLTGKLRAGENDITLRTHNPHHWGGMFRRPFLYRASGQ